MKIGRIYKFISGRFPFNCPYGVFTGKVPDKEYQPVGTAGWPQFVWDGKQIVVNATDENFIEVPFVVDPSVSFVPDGLD